MDITETVAAGAEVRVQNSGGKVLVTIDGVSRGLFGYIDLQPEGSGSSEGRVEVESQGKAVLVWCLTLQRQIT